MQVYKMIAFIDFLKMYRAKEAGRKYTKMLEVIIYVCM